MVWPTLNTKYLDGVAHIKHKVPGWCCPCLTQSAWMVWPTFNTKCLDGWPTLNTKNLDSVYGKQTINVWWHLHAHLKWHDLTRQVTPLILSEGAACKASHVKAMHFRITYTNPFIIEAVFNCQHFHQHKINQIYTFQHFFQTQQRKSYKIG